MGELKPSQYQQDILHALHNSADNLIIQACAGSGKTTTLKMISQAIPRELSTIALCFNKLNAEQFAKKLPGHVEASTMHSLGFRILRDRFGSVTVDSKKGRNIINDMFPALKRGKRYASQQLVDMVKEIETVAGFCLNTRTDPADLGAVRRMVAAYTLNVLKERFTEVCHHCVLYLEKRREVTTVVDFDDMIDLVVHFNIAPKRGFDVILGDEVQDWNRAQADFVALLSQAPSIRAEHHGQLTPLEILMGKAQGQATEARPIEPARVILVGDRRQAIYGWRGADPTSMDRLRQHFNCTEMPLSVCYRCPKSVIRIAQGIVGAEVIQAYENAEEGHVVRASANDMVHTIDGLDDGDLVMCRTNAPLVGPALMLIRQRRKATIRGRDFGKELSNVVRQIEKRFRPDNMNEFRRWVDEWRWQQIRAAEADDMPPTVVEKYQDMAECILIFAEDARSIDGVVREIDDLFSDETQGVVFSSIHRAKGLEAERCVILYPEMIPHPMAYRGGDAAIEQEHNLAYVAVTRAMKELILQEIGDDDRYNGDIIYDAMSGASATYDRETKPYYPAPDPMEI